MRLDGATNTSYSGTFNGGSFNTNGPYTICFWALPATFPAVYYRIILSNAGGDLIRLRFDSGGGFGLVDSVGVTTNANMLASGAATSNVFNHWAATFDGSTFTLWRDGISLATASGTVSGRGAFTSIQIVQDGNASNDFGIYNLFLFDQALTPEQLKTVRNLAWPDVTQSSHVYGWWQLLGSSSTGVDRSQTKSDFTTGTLSTQFFQPQRRWADRSSWWHHLILPQYMLQPPVATTAGNLTNAPDAFISKAAPVVSVAGATSNAPAVTLSVARTLASTAAATTDGPAAALAKAATLASSAQVVTNAPAVALAKASAPFTSVAATVTDGPAAAIAKAAAPIASVAGNVTDAPAAAVPKAATLGSVASIVTNGPAGNVSAGLGAVGADKTDAPPVTLTVARTLAAVAGNVTDAPTVGIAKAVTLTCVAGASTDCPAVTLTVARTLASVCSNTTDCPSVPIAKAGSIASVASIVCIAPGAPLTAARTIGSVASTVTNCPAATVVPQIFLTVSSVCSTTTDGPPPPLMGFFKDVAAPPIQQRRQWPPRPR